ncbi:MAG: hypothetical protein LBF71_05670 [Campylobacteraceae bacterium]|jgi:hypothetical protein|nr:hypothetical protein [Campylobacteraceae bacterium]
MIEKRLFAGIILTFACGFVMFFLYNRAIYYEEKVTLQKQMDSWLMILDNKLNEVSDIALSSSLMLSKNSYIIDCLSQNDKTICSDYLMEIKKIMQDNDVFENMGVHLHTSDYKSFVRLWDYENRAQENLRGFRHSLEKVKNTKKAVQGVEIGHNGVLTRAIVPIYRQDKYIGSIETVVFPERYTEFFKDLNIDFYILMDNKYLEIVNAKNYSENLTLKNYTIVNQNTNGLDFIKDMKFSCTGYLKYGNKYLLHVPIIDINKNNIGYYVLIWNEGY